MATIHDVMPVFELFQPASIDDTLSLLERHRRTVWVLAGGLDTFDWLKTATSGRRWSSTSAVSPVSPASRRPRTAASGSARRHADEIANSPMVKEKFGLLATAAGLVASPQIRNQGTLGGNVSQDTRC